MWKQLSIVAVALLGSAAATASAQSTDSQAGYSISYTTSDLRTTESVRLLHQRIRRIARDNCPSYGVSRELKAGAQCRADITADLVGRIGSPALSALHAGAKSRTVAAN